MLLLRFMKYFIGLIGKSFTVPALQHDIYLPQSLHGYSSLVGVAQMPFKEYVVCPLCHMLYDPLIHNLMEEAGSTKRSVQCKFVKFPSHSQTQFPLSCNTILMTEIKRSRRVNFRARKTYCYCGLKLPLNTFSNVRHS